jgi:hypothetical protein
MNILTYLWKRLTNESAPFFKIIRNICIAVAFIAGVIDGLHAAEITFLPDNYVALAAKIWQIAVAVGIVSQMTVKNNDVLTEK